MKKIFYSILTLFLLCLTAQKAQAAVYYGSGVYTNLCGTGLNATANSCQRGCNTNNGSCQASGNFVVKYTCDGRLGECRNNESNFSTSQNFSGAQCGKTYQIDVFNKTCRVNGNWTCNDQNLVDYMVWYSGDCQAQPTATQTPRPTATTAPTATPLPTATPAHAASCNSLSVVSGQDAYVPSNVTLKASASDNLGNIQKYRFFFGDGKQVESDTQEVTHRYENSGTFTARVEIRDSRGNWRSANSCETQVRVKSIPIIESQQSSCSNVFIEEGNNQLAPTTAKFRITGYDNKGAIQQYRLDFGNGQTQENATGKFERVYETAGTYTIKGYVKDTQGNWKGGENSCKVSLYVNTQPMKEQPKTGTPTLFSVLGLGSGISSMVFLSLRKKMVTS